MEKDRSGDPILKKIYANHERDPYEGYSLIGQNWGFYVLWNNLITVSQWFLPQGCQLRANTLCFGGRTEPFNGKHHEVHKVGQHTLDYFLKRPILVWQCRAVERVKDVVSGENTHMCFWARHLDHYLQHGLFWWWWCGFPLCCMIITEAKDCRGTIQIENRKCNTLNILKSGVQEDSFALQHILTQFYFLSNMRGIYSSHFCLYMFTWPKAKNGNPGAYLST